MTKAVLLFVLLSLGSFARAEAFNFTFSTDPAGCALTGTCGDAINVGSGTFFTDPGTINQGSFGSTIFPITSIVGTIDGSSMAIDTTFGDLASLTQVAGGEWRLFSKGPALAFNDGNGQSWNLVRLDFAGTGIDNILYNVNLNISQPVSLQIVNVPEPAQLSLALVAMLGLAGVCWSRRSSRNAA